MNERRTTLLEFQAQLSERLREAAAGPRSNARLGLQVGSRSVLVELSEAGEIVPMPAGTEMPAACEPQGGIAPPDEATRLAILSQADGRIEIVLASGVVVRVGAAVDQGALCRVLAALSGR